MFVTARSPAGLRFRAAAVTAAIVVVGLASSPARASTGSDAVAVSLRGEVVWAEARMTRSAARQVRIEFLTPPKDHARRVWQSCTIQVSSRGSYGCGLDVAAGSPALRRSGTWAVRVFRDGTIMGRLEFNI